MSTLRISLLTLLAMVAFAGNSVLCRLALKQTTIDAASFTSVRLLSGAVVLSIITYFMHRQRHRDRANNGNWLSALALFVYAATFSFAYINLTTATGALLLFGSVQVTMIGYGLASGERFTRQQFVGLVIALVGLIVLLLPGFSAPPLHDSLLMITAGIAWGIYSLFGKGAKDPTLVTTGNFLRATVFTALLSLAFLTSRQLDGLGLVYAIASGGIASGFGYVVWYTVLPKLKATKAAIIQVSVPVIAAFAGILLLDEAVSVDFILTSLAILSGVSLVIYGKKTR